jgi:hypothetical protein
MLTKWLLYRLENMENTTKKSPFTLHLGDSANHFSLYIVLDGTVIHRISSAIPFIRNLGYPDIVQSPLNANPTITQDKTVFRKLRHIDLTEEIDYKSENCLQYKIEEYLFNKSKLYKEQCGERFAKLIGSCKSLKIENSKKCENCIMLNKK